MKLIIGTRGSKLSLSQTRWAAQKLGEKNPDCTFVIKTITTKGDTDSRPLFTIDQKGIFAKELDRAVDTGEVDFAVHSLKDVPSQIDSGLVLASIPKRESVHDVFISRHTLESIPANSVIGTSSLRRAVQISRKRPDIQVKPIRGNIETRIAKCQDDSFDGIVLAKAGLSRLGVDTRHEVLSVRDFVPSPGQGALGMVCKKDNPDIISILESIQDQNSRLEVESERSLSDVIESGCRFPVGAYGKIHDDTLTLCACAFSVDGKQAISTTQSGPKHDAINIGKVAAQTLYKNGVQQLALNWREKLAEWNK